jgi:hypothetical protein
VSGYTLTPAGPQLVLAGQIAGFLYTRNVTVPVPPTTAPPVEYEGPYDNPPPDTGGAFGFGGPNITLPPPESTDPNAPTEPTGPPLATTGATTRDLAVLAMSLLGAGTYTLAVRRRITRSR